MNPVLGAGLGIMAALGLLLVIAGLTPTPPRPAKPAPGTTQSLTARIGLNTRELQLAAAAFALAVLAAAATGWWLLPVAAPVTAIGLYRFTRPNPAGASIAKVEALEDWVRSLRSLVRTGSQLTEAIAATRTTVHDEIREPVELLIARLRARRSLDDALHAFANDLDDSFGDAVTAILILASRESSQGLANVLDGRATQLARHVRSRRRIEGERSSSYAQIRALALAIPLMFAAFMAFTPFGAAYANPLGQLVLLVLGVLFAACLAWARKIAVPKPATRFLIRERATS